MKAGARTVLLVSTACAIMAGCVAPQSVVGSGQLIEVDRQISGFTEIKAEHTFNVTVTYSPEFAVVIRCDDNVERFLDVRKAGNNLILGLEPGRSYRDTTLLAEVSMPRCESVDLSGSSRASVSGFAPADRFSCSLSGSSALVLLDTEADDVELDASGSSRIEGSLVAGTAGFNLSGSSEVDIVGSADDLVLDGSGSCIVAAEDFFVRDADLNLSGSSRATVSVDGELRVNLSGSSTVFYYGEARLADVNLSGSSTVQQGS